MNRRQRRLFKRKARRIGVVAAAVAMLAATAGLGGAAFAGKVPGCAPQYQGGEGGCVVNGPGFHYTFSVGGVQYSERVPGEAYTEHYIAPNDSYFATLTGVGKTDCC